MLVSHFWLKELVAHSLTPEELAAGLTSLGLEASIAADGRGKYEKIAIGKVQVVAPHPDADKLRLVTVDIGAERKTIVCGAPNVAEGQTVPVALLGAVLPNGLKLEKRKIRGIVSEGMICSESELGLSDESEGILALDCSCAPGTPLKECIEVEDTVVEVDLTPNRGDCLGLTGIAREVAALTGAALTFTADNGDEPSSGIAGFEVRIDNPLECPRYTAREVSGVTIRPSGLKMRRRLRALGVRPINNVVDITNYVMLETGHPLHAFDRRDIAGNAIVTRNAAEGEKFLTLDEREHTLRVGMPVIADGEKGVALAGVMGGRNSEVKDDTADVILEAAYFNPVSIRRTAKTLGISTESSYRFERGVDPEGVPFAGRRAAELMAEHAGGTIGGYVDVYPRKVSTASITLRTERVNGILGLSLSDDDIAGHLSRLGLLFERSEGRFAVQSPSHRHDLSIETDLVEEVARLVGYDNIPATSVRLAQHEAKEENSYAKRRQLNRLWIASGLTEAINYSFINPQWRQWLRIDGDRPVPITNRVNADWAELRTSLLPGLLQCTAHNLRQREETLSLFETGAVFRETDDGIRERFMTAGVITGGKEDVYGLSMPRTFHRMKGIVGKVLKKFTGREAEMIRPARPLPFLYDHRQVEVTVNGTVVGVLGQVHPLAREPFEIEGDIFCFDLSIERLLESVEGKAGIRALPKFPGMRRDLAVLVDETEETGGLMKTILETDRARIRSCRLFDLYRGSQVPEGKKSLAFNLFIQDDETTLTDETADALMAGILSRLKERHNAELRG